MRFNLGIAVGGVLGASAGVLCLFLMKAPERPSPSDATSRVSTSRTEKRATIPEPKKIANQRDARPSPGSKTASVAGPSTVAPPLSTVQRYTARAFAGKGYG